MLSFLSGLLGLLPTLSNTINSITNAIANAKIAQINATDDETKAQLDEKIKALEAQRDVIIAEIGHSNWFQYAQVALTAPVAFVLAKILIWDKALHMGSTDALDPQLWTYITTVIGFYFVSDAALRITRLIKS